MLTQTSFGPRSTRRSTCTPSRSKSSNARGTCDVLIGSLPIRLPIAHDLLRVLAVVLPQLSLQRSRLVSMLHQAPVPRLVDVSQRIPRPQQRPAGNPAEDNQSKPRPVRATDTTAAGTAICATARAVWRSQRVRQVTSRGTHS